MVKPLEIISWNIAHRPQAWRELVTGDADVALLQEACAPPSDLAARLDIDPAPWSTEGAGVTRGWRAAVVGLSPDVSLLHHQPKHLAEACPGELPRQQERPSHYRLR